MAPDAITYRYPDGSWEYGLAAHPPEVGDTLVRRGTTWVASSVSLPVQGHGRVVVLEVAEDGRPQSGS